MALEAGYEEGYLKDTGSRLWQALSESLGYQVTKKRLPYLLAEFSRSQSLSVDSGGQLKVLGSAQSFPRSAARGGFGAIAGISWVAVALWLTSLHQTLAC